MKNRRSLNRRNFLYGSGLALSLPWLETFAAKAEQDTTPRRFVSIYHPDGVGIPLAADPAWKDWSWFPRGGETDFVLSKVLDILTPLRSEICIYSGLSHPAVFAMARPLMLHRQINFASLYSGPSPPPLKP